jgi:3'-phosphoadenosine 5'-phosphosulfate sulfotransferase (PAPS reductase)/FAD synthetase
MFSICHLIDNHILWIPIFGEYFESLAGVCYILIDLPWFFSFSPGKYSGSVFAIFFFCILYLAVIHTFIILFLVTLHHWFHTIDFMQLVAHVSSLSVQDLHKNIQDGLFIPILCLSPEFVHK